MAVIRHEALGVHSRPVRGLSPSLGEPDRLFMILTVYFDESGTHSGSPATIMSGVMGSAKQWARFQTEMDKIKRRYGFTVFHAKEFKARSGEFRGWSPEKGPRLLHDMMIASSSLMEAFTCTLPTQVYQDAYKAGDSHRRLRLDSKYGLCFRYSLLNFLVQAMKRLGSHKKFRETKIYVVMESGHPNAGDAERIFAEMRDELRGADLDLLATISFAGKDGCDPLAIADYLAHGGLLMEMAGRNKNRRDDAIPHGNKSTGMGVMTFTEETLSRFKDDLIDQLKKGQKARFILPSGHRAGRQSS
jgi:Protein of unknown function (DUF3800)